MLIPLKGLPNEKLGVTGGDGNSDKAKKGLPINGAGSDGGFNVVNGVKFGAIDGVNCGLAHESGVNQSARYDVKPRATKERRHRGTFLANGLPALDILDINVKVNSQFILEALWQSSLKLNREREKEFCVRKQCSNKQILFFQFFLN